MTATSRAPAAGILPPGVRFWKGTREVKHTPNLPALSGRMRCATFALAVAASACASLPAAAQNAAVATPAPAGAHAPQLAVPPAAPSAAPPAGLHAPLLTAPPAPPPCPRTMGASTGVVLGPVPPATGALIRDRLGARVGTPSSICRTPFGLYEVLIDGDLFYVDERANFLVNGTVFDLRTQENLTESRKDDVLRVDFKSLPLDLAVKTVRGDGSRLLAVFEDPNCPYCKRFEKQMLGVPNATIYTFLYPILSHDPKEPGDSYPKSMAIWCAPDRAQAWKQVMIEGQRLRPASATCEHPLEHILALGQKLHVVGTPTMIFADGRRAPGLITVEKLEKMFAEAAATPAGNAPQSAPQSAPMTAPTAAPTAAPSAPLPAVPEPAAAPASPPAAGPAP